MPKADAVTLRPDRKPVTVRRPRFSSRKIGLLEMFGDPIDASAVADKDRGLADVLLTASDVPGASRHVLLSPRSRRTTRQQGACGRDPGL